MKNNNLKRSNVFLGIFLLILGIGIGITVNLSPTFAIDTATSNNATTSNATTSNATTSNATTSNATMSNASDTNATSSNVYSNDNILYLESIKFNQTDVNAGGVVPIEKITNGACNTAMRLYFTSNNGIEFNVEVSALNDNPYFEVPSYLSEGTYFLSEVILYGLNSDNSTFTKHYGNDSNADVSTDYSYLFINVKNSEGKDILLNSFSLTKGAVKTNEVVGVNYSSSERLFGMSLEFKSDSGNKFTTYINRYIVNDNAYFMVPTSVPEGNYKLTSVTLMTTDNSTIYTKDKNLDYNISLVVKKNDSNKYLYNSEDLDESIIQEIYAAADHSVVTINASNNSIIPSEVFNSIKGTNKSIDIDYQGNQIIFKGSDIDNPKTIDASIKILDISDDIKSYVSDGFIIDFASNGTLPGKAEINLRLTDDMKKMFGNNKIYVYYYDDIDKMFNLIATDIKPEDGFYKFTINHNSKYVLSKNKISDDMVSNSVVDFVQSNKTNVMVICIALILIVIAVIFIIVSKYKNNGSSNNSNNKKIEDEIEENIEEDVDVIKKNVNKKESNKNGKKQKK